MSYNIIGLFDNINDVNEVRRDLTALGIRDSQIRVSQQSAAGTTGVHEDKGFWASLKELFSTDDTYGDYDYYQEGARRGGILVSVEAPDEMAERVAEVLQRHHAVDLDQRAAEWKSSGWQYGGATSATTGSTGATGTAGSAAGRRTGAGTREATQAIPVTQEELAVGKRQVSRGGIRIVRRVSEKPVEASVNLREEHVTVDRRPVDRDLTSAEANDAFRDNVIEVTESAEEAVANKKTKVVEEVVVGKTVDQRTEKVRDTVRRSDVEVERLPGQSASERTDKVSESAGTSASRTKADV